MHIFNLKQNLPSTYPLRPIMKNNTSTSRITAAAGTSIGRSYISWSIIIIPETGFYNKIVFVIQTI